MSNLYNQQLGQALTTINNLLEQTELSESNKVKSAKLGLYQAHGLTAKAANELKEDQEKSKLAAEQNRVASIGATTVQNIVTTSNAAIIDASTTTSSASIAASSIQKAATALTNLSGSVATTLAVANSLDNGSKIQALVIKANHATKQAANLAEQASIISLNLTIEASQSRAAGVVTQAGIVKTNMATLQKSLIDSFSTLQTAITEDLDEGRSAVVSESAQAGVYKTAMAEEEAILQSEAFINKYINNNLTCEITGIVNGKASEAGSEGNEFKLSFSPFNEKEGDIKIIEEYRIIIVKEDDSAAFNTEAAKSTPLNNYVRIPAKGLMQSASNVVTNPYFQQYVTADYAASKNMAQEKDKVIARDYNGTPVVRGVPYTFFVYVVYTPWFQTQYNDTNGVLSLPAAMFTLRTYLPKVNQAAINTKFFQESGANAVRIAFKVPSKSMVTSDGTDLNELMDFRTFIFNNHDKLAYDLNKDIDLQSRKLTTLEQDYDVCYETYETKQSEYDTAVAQQVPTKELEKKRKALSQAKDSYQLAKNRYSNQVITVQRLTEGKISDFIIDDDIVSALSVANGIVATAISPYAKQQLVETRETIAGEQSDIKTQIDKKQNEIDKLKADYQAKYTTKSTDQAEDDKDNEAIEQIKTEIEKEIAELEKIRSEKIKISDEEDAVEFKEQIPAEQEQQTELLDLIIRNFQEINRLENDEKRTSNQISLLNAELKKLNTDTILANAQLDILNDMNGKLSQQLQSINDHLDQLNQLQKDDKVGDYQYFEAVNKSGDFTDNYGEVLLSGNSYCSLVYTVIKDSEPEAATLFAGRSSGFASPVEYNSVQL